MELGGDVMSDYLARALSHVQLKGAPDMKAALETIETGGLPDDIIVGLRDYFMQYAGTQKTVTGVLSILRGAVGIVDDSDETNSVVLDFYAKEELYIRAIVTDSEEAKEVIVLLALLRLDNVEQE